MSEKVVTNIIAFAVALVATLVLTPLVRETNRRLGMIDKPDPRRINKVPIPRGGGLAVYVSVAAAFLACAPSETLVRAGGSVAPSLLMVVFAGLLTCLGYADDKFSLPPKAKLLGQIAIAVATWWCADLGFRDIFPMLPVGVDCVLTTFWIVGAVNAFNLIDGLDGLASGLALIATIGMAGGLAFAGRTDGLVFYCAFAGGLLGFLRYNYNPASVFLGDSGSMMIGYTLAVLPLMSHAPDSFLVSVGVPLLAMGVPIFDTALAIFRRTVRRLLVRAGVIRLGAGDSANVMSADHDHLHHRVLRACGLNQRKAAWSLYALAATLVLIGLGSMSLRAHAAGLWLAAFTVGVVVILRDMSRVELFDVGRLLNTVAHPQASAKRRLLARLRVPVLVLMDLFALLLAYCFLAWVLNLDFSARTFRLVALLRVGLVFLFLAGFRIYRTVWSRAMSSNYVRLIAATLLGTVLGSAILFYVPIEQEGLLRVRTVLFGSIASLLLVSLRILWPFLRDFFYSLDCARLIQRKDVSRVLVYGSGLRYRAFRRELVRTTSANTRIIVGLLDDDILLRHHFIGGQQILGSLREAPEIINRVNADAVVIACEISPEWMKIVRETLAPTGVRISQFQLTEKEIPNGSV